jgi:selenocysteine lyase/cysteine desulfurase
VIHETAPYTPALPFDLDWLRATLGGGHVRLVAFSAASNVTGELLPAREIVALAHEYGALCLMDAAQTAAVCHLDAASLDVDLLCFAGHKGPLGPQGIGGLWAKDDVPFACPSAACAVGEARDLARIEPGYCDVGGINAAGVLGLAAGSEWLERHPGAFDGARAAASAFAAALRDRDGATVFGGDGPRTATVSFRLDDLSLAESKARFSEEGIVLGAGVHCAPRAIEAIGAADGTLRVSFGVFNRATDVDRVLGAVDACLRTRR